MISSPILDLKSCTHSYLYEKCVIFGHEDYHFSSKGKFVLLQGESFVRMSCSHYTYMFHIHCMCSCHEGHCIKNNMFFMFWMVYFVSLSVPMYDHSQVLSLFTLFSLISHLASFLRNLASSIFLELHAFLLQPSIFFPCLLELCNA